MDNDDKERRAQRVAVEKQAVQELRAHMQTEDEEKTRLRRWHAGKEIPLALMGGLLLNAAGIVWGAATLKSNVEDNEKAALVRISVQTAIDAKQDEEARRMEDRIMSQLEKANAKLDRIIEKGAAK